MSRHYKKTRGSGKGNVVDAATWLRGTLNFTIHGMDNTTGLVVEERLHERMIEDISGLLEEERLRANREAFYLGLHHIGFDYSHQPMILTPSLWEEQKRRWALQNLFAEECKVKGHGNRQQLRVGDKLYSVKWFLLKLRGEETASLPAAALLPYALTGTVFPPSLSAYAKIKIMGNVDKYCLSCGQTKKLKKCKGCNEVAFCSVECQKIMWKYHKKVCKYKK